MTFECSRCKRLSGHRFAVGVAACALAVIGGKAQLRATCEGCGDVDTYDVLVTS